MKIYYNDNNGMILAVNYNKDDFGWKNTINIPYKVYSLDEVDSKLCFSLAHSIARFDSQGLHQYYISNGVLMERSGWAERVEGDI